MGRKRWIVLGAIAALAIAAGAGAWMLRDDYATARIATGYVAKQTCSCVHLSGRPLEACLADLPDNAGERVDVVQNGSTLRASVLFGAIHAQAIYEAGYGCQLIN